MLLVLIILQATLLAYHQLTILVNLFPFNNVRQYSIGERLMECVVNGVFMAVPVAGFLLHIQWMMAAALLVYPALLLCEYLSWWKPYFFGASKEWEQTYQRLFRQTIITLPAIKQNPTPNLHHCILHALILITAVCTYIYFFST